MLRTILNNTEQEIQNLLISKDKEEVGRFIRLLSTDSAARYNLITKLLKEQPFLTKELDIKGSGSNAVVGLKSFFNTIGVDLSTVEAERLVNEVSNNGKTSKQED